MTSLNTTRPYRFIGGPLHNQILAVPDDRAYHEIIKAPKLPSLPMSDMVSVTQACFKRIVYTRRRVAGFEFFMLSTMNEGAYLGAFLGIFPSPKAEKRRRRKINEQKRNEAILRQKGYRPWQANP